MRPDTVIYELLGEWKELVKEFFVILIEYRSDGGMSELVQRWRQKKRQVQGDRRGLASTICIEGER